MNLLYLKARNVLFENRFFNQFCKFYLNFIFLLLLEVEIELWITKVFFKLNHQILRRVLLVLAINLTDFDPLDQA